MAKYKLKKKVKNNLIKVFIIVVLLIVGIILIKDYKYKQTYEYKLLNLNYSKEEIKVLLDNLNSDKIDELLTKEYNKDIVSIINEKYYLSKIQTQSTRNIIFDLGYSGSISVALNKITNRKWNKIYLILVFYIMIQYVI